MHGETIDGVWVPGWKLRYWLLKDRARYAIEKRKTRTWHTIARRLPRELRKWVLVDAASRVWVRDNVTPDEITYDRMYKMIEPRAGH